MWFLINIFIGTLVEMWIDSFFFFYIKVEDKHKWPTRGFVWNKNTSGII